MLSGDWRKRLKRERAEEGEDVREDHRRRREGSRLRRCERGRDRKTCAREHFCCVAQWESEGVMLTKSSSVLLPLPLLPQRQRQMMAKGEL
jgi:hypothetical protein